MGACLLTGPRKSGASPNTPTLRPARACFGYGVAAAGIKEVFGGRANVPSEGGARPYVMNGMSRDPPQGLGGWESLEIAEREYTAVHSEEVAPEMRASGHRGIFGGLGGRPHLGG